jgi:hypothetical protein
MDKHNDQTLVKHLVVKFKLNLMIKLKINSVVKSSG